MNGRVRKIEKALPVGAMLHGALSDYEIIGCIAQDGFGILYKAKGVRRTPDRQSRKGSKAVDDYFVIREFFMYRCSDRGDDGCTVVTPEDIRPTVDNFKDAFYIASRSCAQVSVGNPNIINVIENVSQYDTYYYIVEYLDGETLEDYIQRVGPRSIYESREMLTPIFQAVRHLHRSHIMHTDIYPRHVRFVNSGGKRVPVLFSLYASRHFDDEGAPIWPTAIVVCRTGYAPPEQYHNLDHFSPQADIYALAAMIVFVLSGKHLPDSRTVTEKDIRATLPPALPETMIGTLLHALQPDYACRPASVSSFMDELVEFYDENAKYVPHDERRHSLHDDASDEGSLSVWSRLKDVFSGLIRKSGK